MIGAIIGDIVGSTFEYVGNKTKDFILFESGSAITDDSILTMAVFCALEKCSGNYERLSEYTANEILRWYKKYPNPSGAYGSGFENWCLNSLEAGKIQPPYNSYGNGAAMRVSPVAYFANSLEHCKELSRKVTKVTHNHPEGIKGAEATAVAIYMALNGKSKNEIREYIENNYYPLNKLCNDIRKDYQFDTTCQGTVPQSIQAFLEAINYEDAIRITISLGGDADTMGAITGAIAEAFFGIPKIIEEKVFDYLDDNCKQVVKRMIEKK